MMKIDPTKDGGPACPIVLANGEVWKGATLRDMFAAYAIAGILANTERSTVPHTVAMNGFAYADAMLAERSKQ